MESAIKDKRFILKLATAKRLTHSAGIPNLSIQIFLTQPNHHSNRYSKPSAKNSAYTSEGKGAIPFLNLLTPAPHDLHLPCPQNFVLNSASTIIS